MGEKPTETDEEAERTRPEGAIKRQGPTLPASPQHEPAGLAVSDPGAPGDKAKK